MLKSAPLTIAFIDKRPVAAARALAGLPPADAAAFLDAIPSRVAARALLHLSAWPASLVVAAMAPVSAAAALGGLPYPEATAILRLLAADRREALLAQTSAALRRDYQTSLSFPDDTVGAHMTTAITTLSPDNTAEDAADLFKRAPDATTDMVFIVDESRKLLGVVPATAILRDRGGGPLGAIMDRAVTTVSARARVETVVDLPAWDDRALLPVVSRRKQIIGALSHIAARKASTRDHPTLDVENTSILGAIAEAFVFSASGLGAMLADVEEPRARPRARSRSRNGAPR